MRSGALSETKPVSGGFLINWFYASDSERFWPKILGEKVSVGDYIYFLVGSTKWCRITLSVQNSIPNINAHGRQEASTVRLLVPVTSLHSVGGLDTIRDNRMNSLSFSAAAPLLSMALHGCHWEHLAQPSFYFIFYFLHMLLRLGAHRSTEIQRANTSNYRSLSSGLCCAFTRRLSWPAIYPEEENPAPVNHGIWCEIFVRAH